MEIIGTRANIKKGIAFREITWEECRKIDLTGKKEKYTDKLLRTIHYYGGKAHFQEIFLEIFRYCKENLGCTIFVDAFCGSGILSLLAGQVEYPEIYMNDGLDLVVNYHQCMKDYQKFHNFMIYLQGWDSYLFSERDKYKELLKEAKKAEGTQEYDEQKCIELREKLKKSIAESKERYNQLAEDAEEYIAKGNRYRGTVSVKRAILYYLYRHYTFYGRSSFAPNRENATFNILDLVYTRQFYKNVKGISNLYYKKFISQYLFNENALVMLDPPYMTQTRFDTNAYHKWEFTEKQQRYFLEYISQPGVVAKVIVCGYSTSFYDRRLHKYNLEKGCHWQKVHILKAGSKKRGAREYIWVNFDFTSLALQFPKFFEMVPEESWDYRYRKRKKKKAKKTKSK